MPFHDAFHQGESEARATGTRGEERFENAIDVGRPDASARIANADAAAVGDVIDAEHHVRPVAAVLQRVVEQVHDDLLHAHGVGQHVGAAVAFNADTRGIELGVAATPERQRFLHDLRSAPRLQPHRIDRFADRQQVAHQLRETVDL